VRTDFVGPSRCWDSWTRLPKGGLRAEQRPAYSQKQRLQPILRSRQTVGVRAMPRLFWRVADALDYFLTLARLRILDALAGPEPETPADQQRERDQERLERAFPEIER